MTYLRSLLLFCKKYPHNIFIRYCIFSDFVRSLVLSCPNVSLCGYVELKNDDEELEALKRAAGSTSKSGIIFHNSRGLTCQQIRRHDGRLCSLMTSRCSWKTWTGPRVDLFYLFPAVSDSSRRVVISPWGWMRPSTPHSKENQVIQYFFGWT